MSEATEYEPTDGDVAKWLEENDEKRGVPASLDAETPIELSESAMALLHEEQNQEAAREAAAAKPPPESPENPLYSTKLPTQAKSMEFAMDTKSMGKIQATETERALYWKAILNGVPIIFDLEIMNSIPVRLQSLSVFDLDVVLAAANKDLIEKVIPEGLAPFTGRAQTYAAMMQTLSFNGQEQTKLMFERPYPPLDEAVERVRKAYDAQKYLHDHPRWNAMIAAVRLFEAKCKICNDNLLNKNFWKPASSA